MPDPLVVDSRGRRCPLPVIDLARAAATAPPGARVTVLADDPAARSDVPAWCRLRGHTYVGEQPAAGGGTAYTVEVAG
jgi:cysteine desulfurase